MRQLLCRDWWSGRVWVDVEKLLSDPRFQAFVKGLPKVRATTGGDEHAGE